MKGADIQPGGSVHHTHAGLFSTIPMRFKLCELFERIIRSWGAERIRHLEEGIPVGQSLPVERSVRLTGTLKGTLNLRCEEAFLDWLQVKRADHFLGQYPREEIFEELVSLFCLYLFHDFWNPTDFHIGPIKPIPSGPQDWPAGLPDCSCALLIEYHPVELRLWIGTPADS